jgi:mannosyltransferase OCH1-like enzyme
MVKTITTKKGVGMSLIRVFAVYFLYISSSLFPWHHLSFDDALQTASNLPAIARSYHYMGIEGADLYLFFKDLYNKYALNIHKASTKLKIPKIIHQIWLGSSVPSVYASYIKSWKEKHPDWAYMLWTDENVHTLFPLYNQHFYDEVENYGAKSDILRWEILYRFGGLYVDMDYECLNPLDELHYAYDFYTGIQPLDAVFLQLGAALVGSIPGHPILKHCIETVKDDWHHKGAPTKTGPVHFTRSFYACAGRGTIDIALPPFYVYPLGSMEKPTRQLYNAWIAQGSYAVHWWSKSWMPKQYRPAAFRAIDNDVSAAAWND